MTMMAPTMTMQKVLSLTLCLCFVDATSAWAPRSNAKTSFVGSMYSYRRPFSNRGSPRGSVIRYSSAASEAPSARLTSLVEKSRKAGKFFPFTILDILNGKNATKKLAKIPKVDFTKSL